MFIPSQKETYIYDRREWSVSAFVFIICVSVFWILLFNTRFFLLFPLLLLADQGSLRISVTASEIIIQQGFFFCRRTILYEEIVDIVFRNSAQFVHRNRPPSLKKRDFGAGYKSKESRFFVNLHNNDYCNVATEHAQEIVAAIRKAQPHIKIN